MELTELSMYENQGLAGNLLLGDALGHILWTGFSPHPHVECANASIGY